jgi:FkbM family methyltransferase
MLRKALIRAGIGSCGIAMSYTAGTLNAIFLNFSENGLKIVQEAIMGLKSKIRNILKRIPLIKNLYYVYKKNKTDRIVKKQDLSVIPCIKVVSNEMTFNVLSTHFKFWGLFNAGKWEPETIAFYKKYVSPQKKIIDIGGWIGPTVLIAYSYNPKKISVVEADPANYQILKTNCLNNYLDDKVELNCICVSDKTGDIVSFGYNDENVKDTSTKGIGGKRVKVETVCLEDFLKEKDLATINIIKIDIEGGEQFIQNGLDYISKYPDINILLSIHTPFWIEKQKTANMLLNEFTKFDVYSDNEEVITRENIEKMMLSEAKTSYEGKTGQFFTLILKTKVI